VTGGPDIPQSAWPSVSANGRYVAFDSRASNVVADDTNNDIDVFVRDMQTGVTERVSVTGAGDQAGDAFDATISADGKIVAFTSAAWNLTPNGQRQVFVRDLAQHTTALVSVSSAGDVGNGGSYDPSLSADGRYVMFHSDASNLVGVDGDGNGQQDVFRRDLQTGVTIRVGSNSDDAELDGADDMISGTGRYVVFTSRDALVGDDTNNVTDVYVYDCDLGTTRRASVSTSGVQSNGGHTLSSSISSSGRFVAFVSDATNLAPGGNGNDAVFVRDLGT
jgi:Tol biopolymer transport system component